MHLIVERAPAVHADRPPWLARTPRLRTALIVAANLLGLFAFLWPFVLPALVSSADEGHAGDGPWVLLALGAILLALLFLELGSGGLGPKTVALLGVLGAAMVALRLPGFVAGFSAMFIVVLLAGNAFGPSFGFLLGAVGTFASGLFVGGLGPWLPFQMVAVGWVGAGAGLLPHGRSWSGRLAWLAGYGVVSGYAFGMIMGLWFWPFLTEGSALAWSPTAGAPTNLRRYLGFYAIDAFVWDTFRAIGNAVLVLVVGRPLLGALDRAARRMHLEIDGPSGPASR